MGKKSRNAPGWRARARPYRVVLDLKTGRMGRLIRSIPYSGNWQMLLAPDPDRVPAGIVVRNDIVTRKRHHFELVGFGAVDPGKAPWFLTESISDFRATIEWLEQATGTFVSRDGIGQERISNA